MKFTAEQLQKIYKAKTAEELIELAKAECIEATEEEIKAKFAEMHKEGEIADDELDNVAGGCGGEDSPKHKFNEGQRVIGVNGHEDGRTGTIMSIEYLMVPCYYVKMDDNGEVTRIGEAYLEAYTPSVGAISF